MICHSLGKSQKKIPSSLILFFSDGIGPYVVAIKTSTDNKYRCVKLATKPSLITLSKPRPDRIWNISDDNYN